MKSHVPMAIEEIGLDDQGHLFVRPTAASTDEFTFIWRDASGIRWNRELRTLHAAEPERWDLVQLYRQIIAAVWSEYGVRLSTMPRTVWNRIPAELQTAIEALRPES
jgi:Integron Cassette Protein Hfx_Cass5